MDQFKDMTDAAFAAEANDYLDRLLGNLAFTRTARDFNGEDPMSLRDLAMKLLTDVREDKKGNLAVAMAAALFRLADQKKVRD